MMNVDKYERISIGYGVPKRFYSGLYSIAIGCIKNPANL